MEIGGGSGRIMVVLAGLHCFGWLYNLVVAWLIRHGYDEGYMAIIVAIGVSGTLGGIVLLPAQTPALDLAAFAASGIPMALGSWWRHVRARRAGQDAQRNEVLR